MQRLLHRFRWLVALVLVTSTPGLAELMEGVVHAAVEAGDAIDTHHESDDCGDACGSEDCTAGFFHTCRCNASLLAPPALPLALPVPGETLLATGLPAPSGAIRPAYRSPPFRPPSA